MQIAGNALLDPFGDQIERLYFLTLIVNIEKPNFLSTNINGSTNKILEINTAKICQPVDPALSQLKTNIL